MNTICPFALIFSMLLAGCDSNSLNPTSKKTATQNCIFPQNLFNDGGGHDAGFNWALENGGNCV